MQTPAPSAPQPPTPAPQVVGVEVGTSVPIAVPQTRGDIQALRVRRSELSDQLQSAVSRRERVARELQGATGTDKAGLEQRLSVLDKRIEVLENDIAITGRMLTSAPTYLLAGAEGRPQSPIRGMDPDAFAALIAVFVIFVLSPMAIGVARTLWKRAKHAPPPHNPDEAARLERIEQAVDAIAIEVERISEAQRYTTRLLSESPARPALAPAQAAAEPLRARELEPVPARRDPA